MIFFPVTIPAGLGFIIFLFIMLWPSKNDLDTQKFSRLINSRYKILRSLGRALYILDEFFIRIKLHAFMLLCWLLILGCLTFIYILFFFFFSQFCPKPLNYILATLPPIYLALKNWK